MASPKRKTIKETIIILEDIECHLYLCNVVDTVKNMIQDRIDSDYITSTKDVEEVYKECYLSKETDSYDETTISIKYLHTRKETDYEYNTRTNKEQKEKVDVERAKDKEYQTYLKLKEKFEV